MKKYFIFGAGLFFAFGCAVGKPSSDVPSAPVKNPTATSSSDTVSTWQDYKQLQYNFEFKYPANFGFTDVSYGELSDPSTHVVQLEPVTSSYPGTNYADSAFTISSSFATTTQACITLQNPLSPNGSKTLLETQVINGVAFYKGSGSSAGAGNLYTYTIYRALHGTNCTEIALTVHTTNAQNYEPPLTEVDKTKPMAALEQILGTFKFTK